MIPIYRSRIFVTISYLMKEFTKILIYSVDGGSKRQVNRMEKQLFEMWQWVEMMGF